MGMIFGMETASVKPTVLKMDGSQVTITLLRFLLFDQILLWVHKDQFQLSGSDGPCHQREPEQTSGDLLESLRRDR